MGDVHNKFKDLVESMENELYKKVFSNNVNLEIFTFDDAVRFFVKERRRVEGAKKCLIAIDRESKFKNNDNKTNKELKELFNKKLLNIILKLESQELRLNNS